MATALLKLLRNVTKAGSMEHGAGMFQVTGSGFHVQFSVLSPQSAN